MGAGEFARVRQHLELALEKPVVVTGVPGGDHDIYAALVDVASRQRDTALLERYLPLAEQTARRYGHDLYLAVAQRAQGVWHHLNNEFDMARTRLQQALAGFTGLGCRWQMGRTLYELADLALTEANQSQARAFLFQALSHFEALQAQPDVDRVRRAMPAA